MEPVTDRVMLHEIAKNFFFILMVLLLSCLQTNSSYFNRIQVLWVFT